MCRVGYTCHPSPFSWAVVLRSPRFTGGLDITQLSQPSRRVNRSAPGFFFGWNLVGFRAIFTTYQSTVFLFIIICNLTVASRIYCILITRLSFSRIIKLLLDDNCIDLFQLFVHFLSNKNGFLSASLIHLQIVEFFKGQKVLHSSFMPLLVLVFESKWISCSRARWLDSRHKILE